MHCTIATEKSNLKKVPTSSGSPNENSVDEFLAEKGYRVEDSVILFDGECNLCNGSVNFVLDHDRQGIFKVGETVGKHIEDIFHSYLYSLQRYKVLLDWHC